MLTVQSPLHTVKGPATVHTDLPFHLEGGPTITGKLDEQGKARHDNVVDKPVGKAIYKGRPAEEDDPFTSLDFLLT